MNSRFSIYDVGKIHCSQFSDSARYIQFLQDIFDIWFFSLQLTGITDTTLKCYECNLTDNPECKDVTKSSNIKTVVSIAFKDGYRINWIFSLLSLIRFSLLWFYSQSIQISLVHSLPYSFFTSKKVDKKLLNIWRGEKRKEAYKQFFLFIFIMEINLKNNCWLLTLHFAYMK